jgi:branched-chain amino acid aminotransferase
MTSRSRAVWMDGAVMPLEQATVSVHAHAMQRGSLVFDVGSFHVTPRGPALFRLRDHVDRFLRSASILGMSLTGHARDSRDSRDAPAGTRFDREALESAAREVVVGSGLAEGLVRWSAFYPSMEADLLPRHAAASVAVLAYTPADTLPEAMSDAEREGAILKRASLRVAVFDDARKAGPDVLPPEAKVAAAYLGPMLARRRAVEAGCDEVVLLDREGHIAEAPTANVFAVIGGRLVTPPLGRILPGITRDSAIALAQKDGLHVKEAHLSPAALAGADEAFLTSSSLPIAPVTSILGRAIGSGQPGPITRRLLERLSLIERGEDPRFAHWLTLAVRTPPAPSA